MIFWVVIVLFNVILSFLDWFNMWWDCLILCIEFWILNLLRLWRGIMILLWRCFCKVLVFLLIWLLMIFFKKFLNLDVIVVRLVFNICWFFEICNKLLCIWGVRDFKGFCLDLMLVNIVVILINKFFWVFRICFNFWCCFFFCCNKFVCNFFLVMICKGSLVDCFLFGLLILLLFNVMSVNLKLVLVGICFGFRLIKLWRGIFFVL